MKICDCEQDIAALLCDIPSEWRDQIVKAICASLSDKYKATCVTVKSCETLTSLSAFVPDGTQVCVTFIDENEDEFIRCFNWKDLQNSVLDDIDPSCITSQEDWDAMTFTERVQAIINFACTCTRISSDAPLRLVFDSIEGTPVADPTDYTQWNTFFGLPANGTPFTSVTIVGNEVQLFGGSGIAISDNLFSPGGEGNTHLLQILDDAGAILSVGISAFAADTSLTTVYMRNATSLGGNAFSNCSSLTGLNFPLLQTAGIYCFLNCTNLVSTLGSFPIATFFDQYCFSGCTALGILHFPSCQTFGAKCFIGDTDIVNVSLPAALVLQDSVFSNCTSIEVVSLPKVTTFEGGFQFSYCTNLSILSIPSCTDLGGTVGDDDIFAGITGNTMTLTVPAALMTCNAGDPDGDIQTLQANNTVTVVQV